MPLQLLRVLPLDPIHLTGSKLYLKCSVSSAVDVRIPGSLASLAHDGLVKALALGNLWVTRGTSCHLDIQFLFNGKQLDQDDRVNFLESLGYRIRDLEVCLQFSRMLIDSNSWKLWSKLFLSASLDVWQSSVGPSPDISINLNHGVEYASPQTQHRAWTLDTLDLTPPDSVLRAHLERVQIHFNFSEIPKKQPRAKRIKSDHSGNDDQDVMLLDCPRNIDDGNMSELAHAVEEMKGLSGIIAGCFKSNPDVDDDPNLLLISPWSTFDHWEESASHAPRQSSVENESASQSSAARKRLPKAAVEILEGWLRCHASNPYPTRVEKLELISRTGLQICMAI